MNGDNTVCQSLDTTLLAYDVTEQEERTRVATEITLKSEALLEVLMKYEETLTVEEKGAMFGQTDLIGNLRTVLLLKIILEAAKVTVTLYEEA